VAERACGQTESAEPEPYDELADVDSSPNADSWLAMLRNMWSSQPEKESRYSDLFARLCIQPGVPVLEVGCGAGGASRLLYRLTEGQNPIVAVDPSRLAIEEARRLSSAEGLADAVDYRVMDGRALEFSDGAFGVTFCARVLVHAFEPERLLAEMLRVTRSGGRLLAIEPDRDGLLSDAPADEVNRLMWSRRRSINPRIGRHLYGMLVRAGLRDVEVIPSFRVSTTPPGDTAALEVRQALATHSGDHWSLVEAGLATEQALREYADGLAEAARTGVYLRCDLEFAVLGTKP
jgi:ubiquinone/menaquinone biosynthesis C-methylase UbiE